MDSTADESSFSSTVSADLRESPSGGNADEGGHCTADEEPFVSVIEVEPFNFFCDSESGSEDEESMRDAHVKHSGNDDPENDAEDPNGNNTSGPMLECPRCPFKTPQRINYVRHLRRHLRQDASSLQCPHCDAKYIDSVSLDRHIALHQGKGRKPALPCTICGTNFTREDALKEHLALHEQQEKQYKCTVCQESFVAYKELMAHKAQHPRRPTHICKVCGQGFMQSESLRSHMARHGGSREYGCKVCNKRYLTLSVLKKHMLTHTGERPHQCTTCGSSFTLRCHLIAHKRTHTGERPFRCPAEGCPEAFTTSSGAKRHYMRIHLQPKKRKGSKKGEKPSDEGTGATPAEPVAAPTNHENLTDSPNEKDIENESPPLHEATADKDDEEWDHDLEAKLAEFEAQTKSGPPYQCSKCPSTFPTLNGVRAHAIVHIGPRYFECSVCTKAFATSQAVRRHMLKVHKVRYRHPWAQNFVVPNVPTTAT
ncbi:zinc finger protein 555-like isoform X2 [Ornithodoros turicata]